MLVLLSLRETADSYEHQEAGIKVPLKVGSLRNAVENVVFHLKKKMGRD